MSVQVAGADEWLPGGAALAPGEKILVEGSFMFGTIAFYLHTDLALTNRRLYAVRPNTILGLIPVGTARSNFPLDNIAGVNAGTRFNFLGVIFGVFGLLVGIAALGLPSASAFGVLLIVIALGMIAGAPKQAIEVTNSGGGHIVFPVSFFERGRTLDFASDVSEAIARTPASREPSVVRPPALADETGRTDPSNALRNLQRLRDQGLITEYEYADKRADILRRI
jgi:hypothetical protein